ncbi:hypothetical protein Dsin_029299 [Dipteronia sinensis]|uniref:Uncharacterized protein n=1 Tax=Dipteronia sinensis TaxID=43782 RepID=A0AAD9ZSB8_9ROSI|nr:hypothetical protein Dsin_029299 [Dipteronia sinensis]
MSQIRVVHRIRLYRILLRMKSKKSFQTCSRHAQVEFCICLLLTILGYIHGIIYALYAIVFVNRDEFFDEYRRPLYAP